MIVIIKHIKKILILIPVFLLTAFAFSQNQESFNALYDAAEKMYTWDIEYAEKGAIMFLDVPYHRDNQDSVEYLTLSAAKDKTKARPVFISIIVPGNVIHSNGIFIGFSKDEQAIEQPVRVIFEKCGNDICTARIMDGFVKDEETNKSVDIFQQFLDMGKVYFLFVYPDGSHQSVTVPLFSFKKQYGTLVKTHKKL